jgi:peptidylprolyl isomerase
MIIMGSLLAALLLATTLTACGSDTPTPAPTATEAEPAPTEPGEAPEAEPTQRSATPVPQEEFEYIEIQPGEGIQPQEGDVVTLHYTGTLTDGTVFDSSYERGEPIRFSLGQGMVIPGWEMGVAMMHEGGKARLVIPPDMAYGAQGVSGIIPPNATLIFNVELLSVRAGSPEAPTAVEEEAYTTTESGLQYYVLEEGEGVSPEEGQLVEVHYTGWLTDGTKFDSSLDQGQPFRFLLEEGQLIPGWNEGIEAMKVGGKRQLVIPPELAYGEEGTGGIIPPNATLIFEVELLDVQPGPPEEPTPVEEEAYTTTEQGLQYYDIVEGEGAAAAEGQMISLHYTGWLTDGTRFDSSISRGQPLIILLGSQQVIEGWSEGLPGMRVGGKRQLVIPPELAYGEQGAGDVIPPNATLIFEIELLNVQDQ